ncbi:MAG: protein-export chaperone SecB [Opitutaceae bacterium]|nr:protein-export chaperone SecB [Opitutaceae bacterium]
MKPSPLQLNQTFIGAIVLQPKPPEFSSEVNVTTAQSFARGDVVKNQWQVTLKVSFKGAGDKPAQYEGSIEVSGIFTVTAELAEEQHLRLVAVTCPSLLYSTARETIAMLTARGPHGVFLLPSVSFTDLTLTPTAQPATLPRPAAVASA